MISAQITPKELYEIFSKQYDTSIEDFACVLSFLIQRGKLEQSTTSVEHAFGFSEVNEIRFLLKRKNISDELKDDLNDGLKRLLGESHEMV